eukprot:gene28346-34224_t
MNRERVCSVASGVPELDEVEKRGGLDSFEFLNKDLMSEEHPESIEEALRAKGDQLCVRFCPAGFGGVEEDLSDLLVHRNPVKKSDGSYNYNPYFCVHSFASPYVLRRLLQLKDSVLVIAARCKNTTGTFGSRDDGRVFELLCLHDFKISGVEFRAEPLTEGAEATTVVYPAKESGSAFCPIEIDGRSTLVILQCIIAGTHPVKQNGIRIIHDASRKTGNYLVVDDTVIMFMIPVIGKLNTRTSPTVFLGKRRKIIVVTGTTMPGPFPLRRQGIIRFTP